jgi:hypothetical protein
MIAKVTVQAAKAAQGDPEKWKKPALGRLKDEIDRSK